MVKNKNEILLLLLVDSLFKTKNSKLENLSAKHLTQNKVNLIKTAGQN